MITLLNKAFKKLERTLDFTTNQVMYAQEGEDHILRNHFRDKKDGFFVDVGAFHPKHLSNTAYLYQQGWRGINIEPMKERFKLFENQRKRDVNLNMGIGLKEGTKYFYNTHLAYSSFFKPNKEFKYDLERVEVFTLKRILDTYLPLNQEIDLLSIDTEGNDYNVLLSNNWKIYKPKVVMIETTTNKQKIKNFLEKLGYIQKYNTCLNTIFVRVEA